MSDDPGIAGAPAAAAPRVFDGSPAAAGYATGAVIGKGVGILLLPIITRALQPSEFGQWEVLSTMQSALGSVLLLGIETSSTRMYPDLGTGERRQMFSTWVAMSAGLAALTLLVLWGGAAISESIFDTDGLAVGVILVGVGVAGSLLRQVGLTVLRNHRRPAACATASGIGFIAYGLLVVVMAFLGATATNLMAAMAWSLVVAAIASVFLARHSIGGRPSLDLSRRLLRLGLPLVPAVVAVWATELAARTILLHSDGATQVGYLSLALRFGSIGVLAVLAFEMAWHVEAFAIGHAESGRYKIAHDGRRILVAVATCSVAIGALAPEFIRILGGPSYLPALPAVCGALIFAIAYGAFHIATIPSALARAMGDLGLAASIGAATSIALTMLLAPRFQSAGTAAAIAVGQFTAAIVGLLFARRRTPVPFEWARLALTVAIASAVIAISTLPEGGAPLAVRLVMLAAFAVYLYVEGTAREVTIALTQQRRRRRMTS